MDRGGEGWNRGTTQIFNFVFRNNMFLAMAIAFDYHIWTRLHIVKITNSIRLPTAECEFCEIRRISRGSVIVIK